jgi:hypothetical protein
MKYWQCENGTQLERDNEQKQKENSGFLWWRDLATKILQEAGKQTDETLSDDRQRIGL